MSHRRIIERPVPGGEKFSAVVGPSSGLRRAAGILAGLALASAAVGVVLLARGAGAVALGGSLVLLALSVGAIRIRGGTETIVCQGGVLSHRRSGPVRDRRRSVPVLDVLRIRPPSEPETEGRSPGVRIETARGTWTVGRHLSGRDAHELAAALELHLRIDPSEPVVRPATASRVAGTRVERTPTPLPAAPDKVLRMRNPPPS